MADGYITAAEFATITGRAEAQATTARIKAASRLLDDRIGFHPRQTSGDYEGFKVDIAASEHETYQVEVLQEWTAWMVAYLYDNDDQIDPGVQGRLTLGRFTEENRQGDGRSGYDASMQLADARLVDAGWVELRARRGVELSV